MESSESREVGAPSRPVGEWLHLLLPEVTPYPWPDGCWVGQAKARTPEHHPPLYWLGRALDEMARAGSLEAIGARLLAAHGPTECGGWSEQDQRVQDVLTEACALAWARQHIGAAELHEVASDGEDSEARPLLHVTGLDAWIAPRRLWPVRTLEQLLAQTSELVQQAAYDLPEGARGRVIYLDIPLNMQGWPQDVGYAGPTTDPLRAGLKQLAAEHGLGCVLTRPFQWGSPIEAWY